MEKQEIKKEAWMVGTELKKLVFKPNYQQLFMYSAITWNRHVIHYNRQKARDEGLPDVVVQRGLIGNYFSQLLESGMHHCADILRLEWRVVRSAVPGDTLTCSGVVRRIHERGPNTQIEFDLAMINQIDEMVAKGTGTVQLVG